MSMLFKSLEIGNIQLKNRIVMSPMCQYSSVDGFANDWHFVHYASRAIGGCAVIMQEATSISPEGRITFADLGIWKDEHIEKLSKIVRLIKSHHAVAGVQLAHAGRKASCDLPWNGGKQLTTGKNAWTTISSSPIPFYEEDKVPEELVGEEIKNMVRQFIDAAKRAIDAGYDVLEIHAAHGYLIHQFLSPLTNKRQDEYGGSFENRIRFIMEVVSGIKSVMSPNHSLWVRISATDWAEGGWNIDESVRLSSILKVNGVDVIDVSSGGNIVTAKIPLAQNYQVPFAEKIKKETGIITGAVGLINDVHQAEDILSSHRADLIFMGRLLLRNPYFPLQAAKELGVDVNYPPQYARAK